MNAKINASGEKCIDLGNGCLCPGGLCDNCSTQIGPTVTVDVSGVTAGPPPFGLPPDQINGTHILNYIGGCRWEVIERTPGTFATVGFVFLVELLPTPRMRVEITATGTLGVNQRGEYQAAGLAAPGGKIDCVAELPKVLPFLTEFGIAIDYSTGTVTVS